MSQSARPARRKKRSGFIERTLIDINNTLEQSVFAEEIARQKGLLQGLDPRLKVIAMIMLLSRVNPAIFTAISISSRLSAYSMKVSHVRIGMDAFFISLATP